MNGANLWNPINDQNSTALLGSVVDYLKSNQLPETILNQVYQSVIYSPPPGQKKFPINFGNC